MVNIDFQKGGGLVPVIVQEAATGEVLMLAYMNREAWLKTCQTGKATYWSRARNELWVKGKTSGNVQIVEEIFVDCDSDTILLKVRQMGGAACHTGHKSCFFTKVVDGKTEIIGELIFRPEDVYK
ncbi:MAG TPA: phosphoribosyl-AMP cyclohydrolase [Syntrophales bacterium]|nr:phosphoribosyl-AMP cyclohydrolase [Syntrophales bacterium]